MKAVVSIQRKAGVPASKKDLSKIRSNSDNAFFIYKLYRKRTEQSRMRIPEENVPYHPVRKELKNELQREIFQTENTDISGL